MRHKIKALLGLLITASYTLSIEEVFASDRAAAEQHVNDGLKLDTEHLLRGFFRIRWHIKEPLRDSPAIQNFRSKLAITAEEDFTKAIESDSNYAEAYYYRAEINLIIGKYELALADLSKALEIDPNMVRALWARAACYGFLDQHAKSIDDYNTCQKKFAGQLSQTYGSLYRLRGEQYEASGKLLEALNDFEEAIKAEVGMIDNYMHHSMVCRKLLSSLGSSANKDKILQCCNGSSDASRYLEMTSRNIEEGSTPEKILSYYESQISAYPNCGELRYLFAKWLSKRKENDQALKELNFVLKVDPKYINALALREKVYRDMGNIAAADTDKKVLVTLGYTDAMREQNIEFAAGVKAREQGDVDVAIFYFTRAINADSTFYEAYFRRAELFEFLAKRFPFVTVPSMNAMRVSKAELRQLAANDLKVAASSSKKFIPCTVITMSPKSVDPISGQCWLAVSQDSFKSLVASKGNLARPLPTIVIRASDARVVEKANNPEAKLWALACPAIFTESRHQRHDVLACVDPPKDEEAEKQLLSKNWGINSQTELLAVLERIANEGSRSCWNDYQKAKSSGDYQTLKSKWHDDDREISRRLAVVAEYGEELENKSLLGWDYCRYIELCRWGVLCEYLNSDEAWQKILPQARLIQHRFSSWSDLGRNIVIGADFNSTKDPETQGKNYAADFEKLLSDKESPWMRIPWTTNLEDHNQK